MTDTMPGSPLGATPDPADVPATQPVPALEKHDLAAPAAPPAATPASEVRRESVVCPECGQVAPAALTRRDSGDFCTRCDFPLFWTPSEIQLGDDQRTSAESLRRLPGTAGRVTVASTPCPHCHEANTLSATSCVRCGLPMVVAPEPAPVHVAPAPPPEPAPEPVKRTPWWLWLLLGLTAALLVALVVWYVAR